MVHERDFERVDGLTIVERTPYDACFRRNLLRIHARLEPVFIAEGGFTMTARFAFRVCSMLIGSLLLLPVISSAQLPDCTASGLPNFATLQNALVAVVGQDNGGFGLPMWASIVNRKAEVCLVTQSGPNGTAWPGSRVISAQKANTANAFSLPGLALSTANLYSAVQPGGSLFGLQESNPVDADAAYAGDSNNYGTVNDPLAVDHKKIGGVNVFGGGLALYNSSHQLVGALGVSGDSSCADHVIAWKLRHTLNLDFVPKGVSGDARRPDNIVYDIRAGNSAAVDGKSASGWGQPHCLATDVNPSSLPATQ
jgi:uncharacterized protein GlcG (DUF336 family)